MAQKEALGRLYHIVRKLRSGYASFEEIEDYLEEMSTYESADYVISKRTFQRDLNDLRALHGIDVLYDRTKKKYKIDQEESHIINERMMEAYDTFNAINLTDRIASEIHFEKRKSSGTENLWGLLHAIKNHKIITFTYHSFFKELPEHRSVKPLAIKEHSARWYLLATNSTDDVIKTFALDRLTEMDITPKGFSSDNQFDIETYYQHSFGIVGPNLEANPDTITLQFSAHQGKYVKSLPLHHSQSIVDDSDAGLTVELKLHITKDFVMEVLSHGQDVKVCSPQKLKDEIKQIHLEALKNYE